VDDRNNGSVRSRSVRHTGSHNGVLNAIWEGDDLLRPGNYSGVIRPMDWDNLANRAQLNVDDQRRRAVVVDQIDLERGEDLGGKDVVRYVLCDFRAIVHISRIDVDVVVDRRIEDIVVGDCERGSESCRNCKSNE
jgi:hypothetical protein